MNYINEMEQNFVLGDLDVFNEFDASHFMATAKSAITNKAELVNVNLKFDYYTSMLKKTISSFSTIKLDKNSVREFLTKFNNYSLLDKGNITVKDITVDEITVFKPQYINQYIVMVQNAINDVINDNMDFAAATRFMTDELPIKVEKQVVKTNLPYGMTTNDLRKETTLNSSFVKADTKFVKDKVIPFVTKYDDLKSNTVTEANAVLNAINESEASIKAMINALNTVRMNENISTEKLNLINRLSYNAIRGILNVISFTSFMLIHKLNVISANIITCNKLYTEIFNLYGGEAVTIETALDRMVVNNDEISTGTDLIEGKVSAFDVLSARIYEYHKGMINGIASDAVMNKVEYPKSIYDEIVKAYIIISEGLNIIGREGDDYLLIFDDIINKSGFSLVLIDRFREVINAISDMSMYNIDGMSGVNPDVDMYNMMLSEVRDYSDNMQKIASTCNDTFKKLGMLQERFATNENDEFKDMETTNELKVFMKDLREQFIDMTNAISKNFMKRLKELGDKLSIMDAATDSDVPVSSDDVVPITTDSDLDISESVFDIMVESVCAEHEEYMNTLQKAYLYEKSLTLESVKLVFEAETTDATSGTGTQPQQQNAQAEAQSAAKPDGQNQSTKPTVVDNSKPENNNTNTTPKTSSTGLQSLIDNIEKMWTAIKNVIDNSIKKKAAHNKQFISDNRDGLLNRSYSNVAVNMIPYNHISTDAIIADMNKLKANVSASVLTPQVIQGFNTKDDVIKKIVPFVSGLSANAEKGMREQVYNFYAMGNVNTKPAVKTVANGELKTLVTSEYIPYCEKYYESIAVQMMQISDDIKNALKDTISKLNTEAPQNGNTNAVKTESVLLITEAADNANNTETSMGEKAKWVRDIAKDYSNAVNALLDKRCNDYLDVLNKLKVEARTTTNAQVTDGNDTPNNAQPQNT